MMHARKPFLAYVLLVIVVFLVGFYSRSSSAHVYYRIGYFLLLIGIAAFVITYFSLRGMHLNRINRSDRQVAGQIHEEKFEVENRSGIGNSWVEIRDLSDLPFSESSRIISNVGARQFRSYISRTRLSLRGLFRLGPTVLASGDPFGLFQKIKVEDDYSSLLVLPHVFPITKFTDAHGRSHGGYMLRQKSIEVTPYVAGVREYIQGDTLNRIHWGITAHRDQLMVKEFEQDPEVEAWLILDSKVSSHFMVKDEATQPNQVSFQLPRNSYEYAVAACASICRYYIKLGRPVGFMTAQETVDLIMPDRGERQDIRIMEKLAAVSPTSQTPLATLIEMQKKSFVPGSSIVIFSTIYNSELESIGQELLMRKLIPTFVLIDTSTFGGVQLKEKLQIERIPVYRIAFGDDIQSVLEDTPNPSRR
ncbi:MAG TPA: DUF58 domain-containing protein [Bellilinea sp.]|mgnify:CR=1 FL=1|nr:DUF58 domain-containing protein [Bellilinea sp.]